MMGVEYFVEIPELKILYHIGRNIMTISPEEVSQFTEELNSLRECVEGHMFEEIEEKKLKDINLRDITSLYVMAKKTTSLINYSFETFMILHLLEKNGIEYKIVSEYDVSESKLKKKGWKVLSWWEREET